MRLEPALEIVGTLKRRFGEPMTVTDICRAVPLSYQPVHDYVHRLAEKGAVTLRKEGQRLFCEPAATAAGSIWLAQWSVRELREASGPLIRELAAGLEGRMNEDDASALRIVGLDPVGRNRVDAYVTDGGLQAYLSRARVHVISVARLAEVLAGRDGSWSVARRIMPVMGQQLLWSICLAARERMKTPVERPSRVTVRRRRAFID